MQTLQECVLHVAFSPTMNVAVKTNTLKNIQPFCWFTQDNRQVVILARNVGLRKGDDKKPAIIIGHLQTNKVNIIRNFLLCH